MAPQMLQDLLDRIQSTADWVLRIFLAVILRCLGVLLKAVVRADDKAHHVDEHNAQKQDKKGELIQRHMSGAAQKRNA